MMHGGVRSKVFISILPLDDGLELGCCAHLQLGVGSHGMGASLARSLYFGGAAVIRMDTSHSHGRHDASLFPSCPLMGLAG